MNQTEGNQSMGDTMFATSHVRASMTMNQFNDISNLSMQSGDDSMINYKGNRQSFDFTFSNLASTDQFMLNRLKEAFQCYLKKEEVLSYLRDIFLGFNLTGLIKKYIFYREKVKRLLMKCLGLMRWIRNWIFCALS